jgi:hypothetical protein
MSLVADRNAVVARHVLDLGQVPPVRHVRHVVAHLAVAIVVGHHREPPMSERILSALQVLEREGIYMAVPIGGGRHLPVRAEGQFPAPAVGQGIGHAVPVERVQLADVLDLGAIDGRRFFRNRLQIAHNERDLQPESHAHPGGLSHVVVVFLHPLQLAIVVELDRQRDRSPSLQLVERNNFPGVSGIDIDALHVVAYRKPRLTRSVCFSVVASYSTAASSAASEAHGLDLGRYSGRKKSGGESTQQQSVQQGRGL